MTDLELTLHALVADAPEHAADWNDVLRRARQPRRRRLAALAVALAAAAIVVATPAFGIGSRLVGLFDGGTPVSPEQLSARDLSVLSAMVNGERPPRIPAAKEEELARFGGSSLRQIAERSGRAYFVVDGAHGTHCYAVGRVGSPELFGQIICAPAFPSSERPILNLTTFKGTTGPSEQGGCCVWRLEGFAADGVASVGLVTASGELEAVTAVEDNVYVRTDDLPTEPVREIVALDAHGDQLYGLCLARDGCQDTG